MGFSVAPDLGSKRLSISDERTANPALSISRLAGAFTLSRDTPPYLEGGSRSAGTTRSSSSTTGSMPVGSAPR
ncbi:MAG: hypothetical protein O9345_20160 [Burkholderiaceae bacterium]|jgi:hypothetical protein|nr:hypothetical protein [Burkholderiaceae bacterium]